jgi:hypothetical protein
MWRHLLDVTLLGQIIRPELGQPEGQKIQMNRRVCFQKSQKNEVTGVNVICHQIIVKGVKGEVHPHQLDLQVSVQVKMNHLTEATTNVIIDVIKNQVEIRHTEMIVGMTAGMTALFAGMIEGMTVEEMTDGTIVLGMTAKAEMIAEVGMTVLAEMKGVTPDMITTAVFGVAAVKTVDGIGRVTIIVDQVQDKEMLVMFTNNHLCCIKMVRHTSMGMLVITLQITPTTNSKWLPPHFQTQKRWRCSRKIGSTIAEIHKNWKILRSTSLQHMQIY